MVVDVMVPEQELIRRLAGRRICWSCGTTPRLVGDVRAEVRRRRWCSEPTTGRKWFASACASTRTRRSRCSRTTASGRRFASSMARRRRIRVARDLDAMIDDAATARL